MSAENKDTEQLWSPALRRARKGWKDNRDLLEEFAKIVLDNPTEYPKRDKPVIFFLKRLEEIRSFGYNKSKHTAPLAEWIRQEQRKLMEGGETATVSENTFIQIPMDLSKTLDTLCKTIGLDDQKVYPVSTVFRKEELWNYAKKRAMLLHGTEDLSLYIENLVWKEKSGLESPAGLLFDLLECCEQVIKRKGYHVSKNFEVNICDLWVPELRLGIEPRMAFEAVEEGDLFRLLTLSEIHYNAACLVVVLPNDTEEPNFQSCRSLQHIVLNLKVLRMKDFEDYLDEIARATQDAGADMID